MKEISLFGRALKQSNTDYNKLAAIAAKKGYIVHPDCANDRVLKFLNTLPDDLNSTFYKEWVDVTSKNRIELFIDQIIHYASTYGTDYQGTPYVANTGSSTPQVLFKNCQMISPITPQEIGEKVQSLFDSGIALKQQTIEDCCYLLNEFKLDINVDTIRNREVMMIVCDMQNVLPTKPEEMVRYLVYKRTGQTLLIKNPGTVSRIKLSAAPVDGLIKRFGTAALSQVFYRYKPLLLAMRNSPREKQVINKVRRDATIYHTPYEPGFWENVLSTKVPFDEIEKRAKSLNNFKKVALMQTILIRQAQTGIRLVIVRNQKIYIKASNTRWEDYFVNIYGILEDALIESLSQKNHLKVKLHPHLHLALPTSEKSYIGNIPWGSYADLGDKNVIVGIHWKASEGARDLDLHLTDAKGQRYGWNSAYHNSGVTKDVIYSGDQTYANPHATELMYCANGAPDSVIKVNLFNGADDSKFHVFGAITKDNYKVKANHMVDPNEIVFMTQLQCTSKETLCALIVQNKLMFANLRTGNGRVPGKGSVSQLMIEHAQKTHDCYLDLETVLTKAGFTFTEDSDEANVDLSVMDKSLLIDLLSAPSVQNVAKPQVV